MSNPPLYGMFKKSLSKTPHQKTYLRKTFRKSSGALPELEFYLPGRPLERFATLYDALEAHYAAAETHYVALETNYRL